MIYALPAIRALGGGALYLSEAHPGREPLTAARRDVLLLLLERIDYLEAVRVHQGESVDVDFTGFRKHLRPGEVNLAQAQLAGCGLPLDLADEAWIDRTIFRAGGASFAVVIHRSERYRNPLFPWKTVVEKFGRRASFVGLTREYLDFVSQHGSGFFRPTKNLLEMAELIAEELNEDLGFIDEALDRLSNSSGNGRVAKNPADEFLVSFLVAARGALVNQSDAISPVQKAASQIAAQRSTSSYDDLMPNLSKATSGTPRPKETK